MYFKTIIVAALCLSSLSSSAQNLTKALKIDYEVVKYKGAQADKAQLYIYSKGAYYAASYDDSVTEAIGSTSEHMPNTSSYIQMRYEKSSDSIYSLAKMKNLHPKGVLIGEKRKAIEWNFIDSNRLIDGHLCQLVEGSFRGRKYIVWCNPNIDARRIGPWKLHGVPGAIIYAYDTTKYITFRALKVTYINEDEALKAVVKPKLTIVSRDAQRAHYEEAVRKKIEGIEAPEGFSYDLKVTLDRLEKE